MNIHNITATLTCVALVLLMPTYLVAEESIIKEKESEKKGSFEDATFFYNLSQFLIPEPTKSFTTPSIRKPLPDSEVFASNPYTVPKGIVYLESNPVFISGKSSSDPKTYNSPTLLRYGLNDNVELQLFSNSLTVEFDHSNRTGFSPIVFGMKLHFWDENEALYLPSVGLEVFLQSSFGSSFLNTGVQPSLNLLFGKELPWDMILDTSVGFQSNNIGLDRGGDGFELEVSGALTKKITHRLSFFTQALYDGAVNPDLSNNILVGGGAIIYLTNSIAIWGSYNAGLVKDLPPYISYFGTAFAF